MNPTGLDFFNRTFLITDLISPVIVGLFWHLISSSFYWRINSIGIYGNYWHSKVLPLPFGNCFVFLLWLFPFYNNLIFKIYWKAELRERNLSFTSSFPKWPQWLGLCEAKVKGQEPEASSGYPKCRGPCTWAVLCYVPRHINRELG